MSEHIDTGRLRADLDAADETEQRLWALAHGTALLDEVERLRRWKAEALPVLDGLQDLGRALGVGIGTRITGREALDAALDLRNERAVLRSALERVAFLLDEPEDCAVAAGEAYAVASHALRPR